MKTILTTLTLKLALVGVNATIEFIPGEGGGVNVRVGSVQDVFAAEPIASEFQTRYGIDTLVCF